MMVVNEKNLRCRLQCRRGNPTMDTIRKRLAQSNEQCEETPAASAVEQHDRPTRPLDLLFPPDAFASDVVASDDPPAPSSDVPEILQPEHVPLFRRIRSKPRRLAAPVSLSAPDWSLSLGAGVVLLGFAIVFGTWVTVTQRDAMQSRLRQIVSQNELRAMPKHEHATIADRTQELARALREQIETLRSRDATGAAVVAGTTASAPARAHSSTLASNAPALPPGSPAPATKPAAAKTPAKTASKASPPPAAQSQAKVLAARPLAPPLPQPAPRGRQLANAAPPPARVASTAQHAQKEQHEQKEKLAAARPAPRPTKTAAANAASHKPKASTVAARSTAKKPAARPVQYAGPPTMQAYAPPEHPVALPASDDKEVYRQH
jgi:hypothetical protein